MPTSSSLREFAQAPGAFLPTPPTTRVVDGPRYFATIPANGRYINATRLHFGVSETANVLAEVHALASGALASWITASTDLAAALRAAGARDPTSPLLPEFTALATETPPPPAPHVVVRRIETLEESRQGLEIDLASGGYSEEDAARRRADAADAYAKRQALPGGEWLAYLDGFPAAYAGAVAGPRGLYLAGGATLPQARGRGLYRALVRARWDDAVARRTPALVVHAQETSRPILERCGFEPVCAMFELESGPT